MLKTIHHNNDYYDSATSTWCRLVVHTTYTHVTTSCGLIEGNYKHFIMYKSRVYTERQWSALCQWVKLQAEGSEWKQSTHTIIITSRAAVWISPIYRAASIADTVTWRNGSHPDSSQLVDGGLVTWRNGSHPDSQLASGCVVQLPGGMVHTRQQLASGWWFSYLEEWFTPRQQLASGWWFSYLEEWFTPRQLASQWMVVQLPGGMVHTRQQLASGWWFCYLEEWFTPDSQLVDGGFVTWRNGSHPDSSQLVDGGFVTWRNGSHPDSSQLVDGGLVTWRNGSHPDSSQLVDGGLVTWRNGSHQIAASQWMVVQLPGGMVHTRQQLASGWWFCYLTHILRRHLIKGD